MLSCTLQSAADVLAHLHTLSNTYTYMVPVPFLPLPSPAGGTARVVTAADLAAADVVLTTYDVLRRDVNHCPDAGSEEAGAGHSLRGRKKYQASVCKGGLAGFD